MKKVFLVILAATVPIITFAQTSVTNPNLGFSGLDSLIRLFANGVVRSTGYMMFTLAVVAFFWGIIKFIWSSRNGSDGKGASNGKSFMVWGLIALFVMFSVWGIIKFAQGVFGIQGDNTIIVPDLNFKPGTAGGDTGSSLGGGFGAPTLNSGGDRGSSSGSGSGNQNSSINGGSNSGSSRGSSSGNQNSATNVGSGGNSSRTSTVDLTKYNACVNMGRGTGECLAVSTVTSSNSNTSSNANTTNSSNNSTNTNGQGTGAQCDSITNENQRIQCYANQANTNNEAVANAGERNTTTSSTFNQAKFTDCVNNSGLNEGQCAAMATTKTSASSGASATTGSTASRSTGNRCDSITDETQRLVCYSDEANTSNENTANGSPAVFLRNEETYQNCINGGRSSAECSVTSSESVTSGTGFFGSIGNAFSSGWNSVTSSVSSVWDSITGSGSNNYVNNDAASTYDSQNSFDLMNDQYPSNGGLLEGQ